MTDLKCSVTSCASNDGSLCRLNSIHVSGQSAHSKIETLCSSFSEKSSAPTNSMAGGQSGKVETEVKCDASDCQYNQSSTCNASYIYVQGAGGQNSNDTRCDTFKAK